MRKLAFILLVLSILGVASAQSVGAYGTQAGLLNTWRAAVIGNGIAWQTLGGKYTVMVDTAVWTRGPAANTKTITFSGNVWFVAVWDSDSTLTVWGPKFASAWTASGVVKKTTTLLFPAKSVVTIPGGPLKSIELYRDNADTGKTVVMGVWAVIGR
jgi:hypothetical protein